MYSEPSTPVCKQQSFSSKGAASSIELAVVEAQNPFSAHCIVLHRIASYQYNISYNNQQAQANCIRMEMQWVRETEEDAHFIPSQLAGSVFYILFISDLHCTFHCTSI